MSRHVLEHLTGIEISREDGQSSTVGVREAVKIEVKVKVKLSSGLEAVP